MVKHLEAFFAFTTVVLGLIALIQHIVNSKKENETFDKETKEINEKRKLNNEKQ